MSFETKPHLKAAFRKLMRPLVALLLREQISCIDFKSLLDEVFIDTAMRDGLSADVPRTLAKVSLATGLNKKTIEDYVYRSDRVVKPEPVLTTVLSEIVHRWSSDTAFTVPYSAVPLELNYDFPPGTNFVELVNSAGADIAPKILLEELISSGAVKTVLQDDGSTRFRIVERAFVFQNSANLSPAMIEYCATVMTDLAATLAHNLKPNAVDKRIERTVYSTQGLTQKQANRFDALARVSINSVIAELDDLLGAMAKENEGEPDLDRVEIGVNFCEFIRPRVVEASLKAKMFTPSPQS